MSFKFAYIYFVILTASQAYSEQKFYPLETFKSNPAFILRSLGSSHLVKYAQYLYIYLYFS